MRKKRGCLRPVFLLAFTLLLLYFTVGEGKVTILKKIYPVKYQKYVEKYAEEYSLDKYLVYSVIRVESGFDPNAVSTADAKGLMQLMDRTAEECNNKGNLGYSIPEDLYDPEKNIHMGCSYLKKLMDTYGDVSLAVTAYNGGTGNVGRWLKDESLSDGEGGLKAIPYEETDKYVKKVMHAYERYTEIYKMNVEG